VPHTKGMHDWEDVQKEEQRSLSHTPQSDDDGPDDGPEFSSEPMPAAFSACLFLGAAVVIGVLLAIFW
jgi:hypothetical protein